MDSAWVPPDEGILSQFLESHPSVGYIRLQWLDLSGILRIRVLIREHYLRLVKEKRQYGVGPALMSFTVTGVYIDEPPIQRVFELRPDWSSLRLCHFAPGHASVMCFAYCREAEEPLAQCPRQALSKVLHKFQEQHHAQLLVGFEVEFVLLDSTWQACNTIDTIEAWSTSAGLRDEKLQVLESIVKLLKASDIEVYHFHTEDQHQLEVSTGPLPPMQAIDALLHTCEIIKSVCIRHGMRATLTPKPLLGGAFNGATPHISINPSDAQDAFLAGMLHRLPLLWAFGMANYDSYFRMRSAVDGTGSWACWGTQNRDVPIRKIHDGHWELRFVDATTNFYLLMAVVLNAGMAGINEQRELKWKDLRHCPSTMSKEQLSDLGVTQRLPVSMRESLALLRENTEIRELLGEEMTRLYIEVKEKDESVFHKMSDEERRKIFIRYF